MKYVWPDENIYNFDDYTYVLISNYVNADTEDLLLSLIRELEREKRYETIQN